ncbi:MAG: flagellar biosynthetic protein FliR [Legionella sp.]|nr:flagellar biosynthetic protein FliR [Legionella sp.]
MIIQPQLLASINEQSTVFMLLMTRFTTLFLTLGFFRREMLPIKISFFIAAGFSGFVLLYKAPVLGELLAAPDKMALNLLQQLVLGVLTGFILNIFIDLFLAIGQIISIQSGLGFVNLFIPKIGTVTPLSEFYFITSALIFFTLNGHLVVFKMLINTPLLPIDKIDMTVLRDIMVYTKVIFSGSLLLSFPVIIALLIANITIAVMTKFSPQLNIFSIGINITLILCFFVAYISFDGLLENGKIVLNQTLVFLKYVIGSLD